MNNESVKPFVTLARWIIIAVVAGASSAAVVTVFNVTVKWTAATAGGLLPHARFLLPVLGAFLVGSTILRWIPGAGGEGVPSYILGANRNDGRLSLPGTILKLPASVLTLGLYGSGGIVGPLVRICSGMVSSIVDRMLRSLKLHDDEVIRIAAICGASGAVSSIFHCPLGGGFFAAEVLRKDTIRYSDLFPSILTVRLFGTNYILPAVIGGILAFLLYKRNTIYEYSKSPWIADADRGPDM